MKPHEAHPGQIIADLYRLEEPLGRGGMGSIWRAEQLRLKSKVAIKFLDPAISDDPETYNRFVREAQAAAAVRSAHVVQIFDCGVDEGTPYISMELLRGEGLDKRLQAQTVLTPAELCVVFTEVARAVDTAHELGVIHRDLKPGNVFLARERDREITKVLDFGIAKLMHAVPEVDSAAGTRTGTMLGTPFYMSPEQVRGRRDLDQRTDLWSLAIIAFECLTGQLPFRGDSMGDIVVRICTSQPPAPSKLALVPAGFDEWFSKGTSKDPNARFVSAREMAECLSEILEPVLAARSQRPLGEAKTLASVPAPSAPDATAHETRPLGRRARTGTAKLTESARVPPSASTGPLTTVVSTVPGRAALGAGPGSRARWLWVAASLCFVCGASALVLRPPPIDHAPASDAAERSPAGSAPEAQLGFPRAPAARGDTAQPASTSAAAQVAPLQPTLEQRVTPLLPGVPRPEPAAELSVPAAGVEPSGHAAPAAAEEQPPGAASEREAIEPAARPRRARAKTSGPSRASLRASAARRLPANPAKKAGPPKPAPRRTPEPDTRPAGTRQVPSEVDPFAERR